jgi:PAS domain S-box-containing protein
MSTPSTMPPSEPANTSTTGAGGSAVILMHNDPINILIVDDEPKNLTVLETVLDDPGYRLVRAESADQALLALVAKEFALLILDIRMPGMTGFELAHLIRQRRKTEQVPIIFLTAYYNEDQHVLEGYGTGAVDYLHKPVNPIILRSKVAIFADLHRKTRALEVTNRALLAEVTERRDTQSRLRELNETLEQRVTQRTDELREGMRQLEAQREQLRASEEFNRSLMEGTADCVQVLDLQGRLLFVNSPGRAQLEIRESEPLREKQWALLWPQEAREAVQRCLAQAREGSAASCTVLRPTPNGAPKWWNVLVSGVRDRVNGQIARLLAVSRDVTEARETEQALRKSDQEKDNFIATLAHELRNPLAPISNAVQLMRHKEPADPQLTWCRDVIERQVSQMSRLLEALLDVSRITRSKLSLHLERLDVASVIEQAIELAQPWIDKGGQAFAVTLPSEPLAVVGDLTRLAQVVSNILINAAKYTPSGGHIELSAARKGDDVVVKVKDNGIGIAAEHLAHIFEMFSQIPSGYSASQGGLGIGLCLARGVVELHGGRLVADSPGLGQGSEFVVTLPLARAGIPAKATDSESTSAPATVESTAAGRCRVLVVDDLRDSADSLGGVLEAMGHEVRVIYEGEQAVRVAEQFRPHVAFIDLGMPGVDGFEVCRRIRAQGLNMLLVAQTGWGQEFDRRRTQAAGFNQHMVKPLELSVVEAVLRRVAAGIER